MSNPETGVKHDAGKPPMSLLDRYALEQIAQVLAFGSRKYASDNWRGGIKHRRLIDAALRHLMAIADGEDIDPESGLLHASHASCCLMFLIWMQKHRPDLDDRYKPNTSGGNSGRQRQPDLPEERATEIVSVRASKRDAG